MNWLASLKSFHLRHFSKAKHERPLLRAVHRQRATRIVELGISDLERTMRLLQVAQSAQPEQVVHYTGIDRFETRPAELPELSLKETHQRLVASPYKARLAPGSAQQVVPRLANELGDTDLLLISGIEDLPAEADFWYYVPRMLQPGSLVLHEREREGAVVFERVALEEIRQRAEGAARRRRRRAA